MLKKRIRNPFQGSDWMLPNFCLRDGRKRLAFRGNGVINTEGRGFKICLKTK